MSTWISGIFLALLLFWAVGAYNRLIRLRSAALQAFGALDAHWQRWLALLAEYATARTGLADADADTAASPEAASGTQTALGAAAAQFGASLAVARSRPLDDGTAAALSAAAQVLDTAWHTVIHDAARASEGVAPPALAPWIHQREQLALHSGEARRLFNEAVAVYNRAISEFPANLLAWLFGMKQGRAL